MITANLIDLLWLLLAAVLLGGGMCILAGFVTGWLVYRSKRESTERLFPGKPAQRKGPKNIDEFAAMEEDPGLPTAIDIQNRVFGSVFAKNELKKEKGNG